MLGAVAELQGAALALEGRLAARGAAVKAARADLEEVYERQEQCVGEGGAARARAQRAEWVAAGLLAGEASAEEEMRDVMERHDAELAELRAAAAQAAAACDELQRAAAEAGTAAQRQREALVRVREVCAGNLRRRVECASSSEQRLWPMAQSTLDAQQALADCLRRVFPEAAGEGARLFAPAELAGVGVERGLEELELLSREAQALLAAGAAATCARGQGEGGWVSRWKVRGVRRSPDLLGPCLLLYVGRNFQLKFLVVPVQLD